MPSLAQYALLGSLLAGAAGALVLIAVTVRHGLKRDRPSDGDETPDDTVRRQRRVRLADTVAVLCFAVAAGLGVIGLMQHTRAASPVVAAVDGAPVIDRLQALENRLASTELELQTRSGPAPEWRAWEDRLARLESRLGAVEERAAVMERGVPAPRTPTPRAIAPAVATPRVLPPKVLPAPVSPSASPRVSPAPVAPSPAPYVPPAQTAAPAPVVTSPPVASAPPAVSAPPLELHAPRATAEPPVAPVAPPSPVVATPRPAVVAPPVTAPRREPVRTKPQVAEEDLPILEKMRRDWETVKSEARRGGEEWREGWDQIKRLFR